MELVYKPSPCLSRKYYNIHIQNMHTYNKLYTTNRCTWADADKL